jgi:hypothetical protein
VLRRGDPSHTYKESQWMTGDTALNEEMTFPKPVPDYSLHSRGSYISHCIEKSIG